MLNTVKCENKIQPKVNWSKAGFMSGAVFIRQGHNISSVNQPIFLMAFNQANKQGRSLQKHIAMHSHTARKPTLPWPQRQKALDNIMAAITSLKWTSFLLQCHALTWIMWVSIYLCTHINYFSTQLNGIFYQSIWIFGSIWKLVPFFFFFSFANY